MGALLSTRKLALDKGEPKARTDYEDRFEHSLLHGKIVEDCLAARWMPTLFDEFLKSLQISLDPQGHHFQCISYMFGGTLKVIL